MTALETGTSESVSDAVKGATQFRVLCVKHGTGACVVSVFNTSGVKKKRKAGKTFIH
jgi:hypothetical protein